ncbi:uncharacterized protein LOC142231300 [Haematobia irritans]|uniref:uncharacterized protein LOC142231300 n=1 Tax=Haematobia irritans TaxID=7368 RepID=UPI003F5039C2
MLPFDEEHFCRSCLVKLEMDTAFEDQEDAMKFVKISTSPDVQLLIDLCLRGQSSGITYNLPNMCRQCFEKWQDFSRYYEILVRNNIRLEKILVKKLTNGAAEEEQANKIFIETPGDLMEIEKYETNSPFYENNNLNDDSCHSIEDIPVECNSIGNSPQMDVLENEDSILNTHHDGDIVKTTKAKISRGRSKASMIKRKYTRRNAAKIHGREPSFSGNITKKARYRCEPCKKYFYEINRYKGHIKLVHEGISKAFQCSHCGKGYKFYKNLTEHIADNHSNKHQEAPFCELCNKEFKTQTTLKNHMKIKHPNDKSTITNRRAICEQCGFIASSPESLTAHIKNKHTEAERFKCEHCPKVFKCRYYLKHHIMTHHSEVKIKPFQCSECDMAFSRRNGLTKHKFTHLNYTERIKCDFEGCDVRFLNNDAKKRHIQLVHLKLKQHVCDICGEAFGIKATLRHHRYIHTGEKPYKCSVCGQGFRQHTAMKTHTKIHLAKNSKYEIRRSSIDVEQTSVHLLQVDLDSFDDWCRVYLMDLNLRKCKFMRFFRSRPIDVRYSIRGSLLEEVDSFVDLGIVMDRRLNFNGHIDSMMSSSALTKSNAKERCRTCLSKLIKNEDNLEDVDSGKNFVCINANPELKDLLEKYVGIEGDEETNQDKDYPASVCINCMGHLQQFETFRNKALDSAEKLFRVFRGTRECKIELDDNGLENIRDHQSAGKEHENDIFNMLLKDSLMETEAILLEGAESDNVDNNMDPDPFQAEICKNIRTFKKTKRKVDPSAKDNGTKSKINKPNFTTNKTTRKKKRKEMANFDSHINDDVTEEIEGDEEKQQTMEILEEVSEIPCEVKVKEIDEEYDDWQQMDFHTNDSNDSSDDEVLSKKVENSRSGQRKKSKVYPKVEPSDDVFANDNDSDPDFILETYKKAGELKKSPNGRNDMNELQVKDMDNKFDIESSPSSESDFDMKHKKKKSSPSPGKRSAASGRKKGLTNQYKCEMCSRRFAHKITLDAHVRKVHQGEKRAYKCELCDKSYSFMGGLSTHMRETHERQEEAYTCKIPGCDKKYTSYITLQRHIRVKHLMSEIPTRYVCEQCGATFKQTSNLRYHMRTRHPTEEDLKQKEIIKERLECEICKKSFNSQYTLKYHKLRIHADDKKYECKICGRRVAKKFMLDQHMLVHSEDKTACKFCGREFVRKYQVEAHIKAVHQKLKPFQCSHCSESFASRKTLRHHVYIHTGEKPYVCDICGQAYRQPTCLKNHRKIHNKGNNNSGNTIQEPETAIIEAAAIANRNFMNTLMQESENVMDTNDLGLN